MVETRATQKLNLWKTNIIAWGNLELTIFTSNKEIPVPILPELERNRNHKTTPEFR